MQFVAGLLQTKEYATAVVQLGHRRAPMEEIDRRVSLRLARQQILTRADPPQLWAVVDEGALRRPIGGPGVIRGQIEALIEATKMPNVRLQVIPFQAGGHAAAGGSFTILRFPDQGTLIGRAIEQGVELFRAFDFLDASGNLLVLFSDGQRRESGLRGQ